MPLRHQHEPRRPPSAAMAGHYRLLIQGLAGGIAIVLAVALAAVGALALLVS